MLLADTTIDINGDDPTHSERHWHVGQFPLDVADPEENLFVPDAPVWVLTGRAGRVTGMRAICKARAARPLQRWFEEQEAKADSAVVDDYWLRRKKAAHRRRRPLTTTPATSRRGLMLVILPTAVRYEHSRRGPAGRRDRRMAGRTDSRLGYSTPQAAMRYQHALQGRDNQTAAMLSRMAAGSPEKP